MFESHCSHLFSYKLMFVYMVILVITRNFLLSKEPNFILIFLGKSCTTFIHSSFIGKFVQKKLHFCDTVMLSEPGIKFWLMFFLSVVTVTVWHVITSRPWHYKPKNPMNVLQRFPTEECDNGTVPCTMSHSFIPHLSWSGEC